MLDESSSVMIAHHRGANHSAAALSFGLNFVSISRLTPTVSRWKLDQHVVPQPLFGSS
jgi:hypothetical protein